MCVPVDRVLSRPANRSPHRLISGCTFGTGVIVGSFTTLFECTVGADSRIGTFVEVQRDGRIGARCSIGSHSFVCEGVVLADDVCIGGGVAFVSDDRPASGGSQISPQLPGGAHVGERASIGSGAVILGGVHIGAGAMVGAGVVVRANVEPGSNVRC